MHCVCDIIFPRIRQHRYIPMPPPNKYVKKKYCMLCVDIVLTQAHAPPKTRACFALPTNAPSTLPVPPFEKGETRSSADLISLHNTNPSLSTRGLCAV